MFIFIYLCLLPKFSYLRFLHNSEMTRLFTMDIALGIQTNPTNMIYDYPADTR